MIVTEAEAAAHFCVKTEIRKDIPSETKPEMQKKANTPFLLVDIGGRYFKSTNNLTEDSIKTPLKIPFIPRVYMNENGLGLDPTQFCRV